MARGPRGTSSKAPTTGTARRAGKGGGKAKAQPGAKAQKRFAAKGAVATAAAKGPRKGTRQRTASKAQQRRPSEQSQSWGSLITSLVTSTLGRAILADVLEAAAAALKKERPGLEQAGADQIARAGEAATSAGSEIVSGTAALAQRAVSVLTEAVADGLSIALKGMAADDRKNLKGIARRSAPYNPFRPQGGPGFARVFGEAGGSNRPWLSARGRPRHCRLQAVKSYATLLGSCSIAWRCPAPRPPRTMRRGLSSSGTSRTRSTVSRPFSKVTLTWSAMLNVCLKVRAATPRERASPRPSLSPPVAVARNGCPLSRPQGAVMVRHVARERCSTRSPSGASVPSRPGPRASA